MALQTSNEEKIARVGGILDNNNTSYRFADTDECNGVYIDDFISFDTMAEIVDCLRTLTPNKELFEECWLAYNRKGSKKKSLEYWKKLTDVEKQNVMPHIKAYVSTRELQYQKDFERYLRDKIFMTVVFNGNKVVYDPTKLGRGEKAKEVYMPTCDGALYWNDYYSSFIFVGFWDGRHISDGYTDETRPNGATIMLNNGRGYITWNKNTKQWEKV